MKKTESKQEPAFISQECLLATLRFLFCPTLEEEDPELSAFAKAIVARANKLDQDADQCRAFYKKLYKKDGIPQEVQLANFRALAKRIR